MISVIQNIIMKLKDLILLYYAARNVSQLNTDAPTHKASAQYKVYNN